MTDHHPRTNDCEAQCGSWEIFSKTSFNDSIVEQGFKNGIRRCDAISLSDTTTYAATQAGTRLVSKRERPTAEQRTCTILYQSRNRLLNNRQNDQPFQEAEHHNQKLIAKVKYYRVPREARIPNIYLEGCSKSLAKNTNNDK